MAWPSGWHTNLCPGLHRLHRTDGRERLSHALVWGSFPKLNLVLCRRHVRRFPGRQHHERFPLTGNPPAPPAMDSSLPGVSAGTNAAGREDSRLGEHARFRRGGLVLRTKSLCIETPRPPAGEGQG